MAAQVRGPLHALPVGEESYPLRRFDLVGLLARLFLVHLQDEARDVAVHLRSMNRIEPVVRSVGLIPPGRLGDVQKVGMLRHDDRSLSTLLNVAQIADLKSDRILS